MAKYLDELGLAILWGKIKTLVQNNKVTVDSALNSTSTNPVENKAINSALGNKVDKVSGKGLSTEDYTTAEKTKLSNISAGAEVNQNSFSNVTVGNSTIAANSETDSLILQAGSDKVTITADTSTKTITIDASGAVTGVKGNSESTYRIGNVNITKANIGLGNVDNTSDANKPISTATQTALDTKANKTETVSTITYDTTNNKITKTINGTTTDVVSIETIKSDLDLTKSDVGLSNVDNTADANKTVSKANTLVTARYLDGVSFNGGANASHYATCSTAAATAAKTATISPTMTFSLVTGARVFIKFSNTNTASNPTLSVNSSDAKPIYYNGAALESNSIDAGGTYEFVYNGTQWELVGDLDTNGEYTVFTGSPTTNQTPSFGGTFTVQQISQSANGQVSGTNRTVTIPNTLASGSANGLMSSALFTKLSDLPTNATLTSTYATKSEITGMYKYKGSVASESNLPETGQTTGDVYNIEASSVYGGAGMNVAWNGSAWDPLGEIFTITSIASAEIDEICA